jgi:hypothetical protein
MHLHCLINADALSAGDKAGKDARACCNDRHWPAGSAVASMPWSLASSNQRLAHAVTSSRSNQIRF